MDFLKIGGLPEKKGPVLPNGASPQTQNFLDLSGIHELKSPTQGVLERCPTDQKERHIADLFDWSTTL